MDKDIDKIGKSINEDKNVMLKDVPDDQGVEFAEEMESFKETKDKRFILYNISNWKPIFLGRIFS